MTLRSRALVFFTAAALILSGSLVSLHAAPQAPPETGVLAGSIPAFKIEPGEIALHRRAQPQTPLDKVGRKFALIGFEGGGFEAWAYPLKLFRGLELSFLLGTSTVPIEGRDIVRFVSVDPAVTTLTYTYQSFTVKAHIVAPADDPGAVILLDIDSTEPLTIVCSFLPVLQPMWPAGIGGQYAYWDDGLKAYLISEPTRKNHGYLGSPAAKGISYTPAHMLSDVPNQFKIEIADPKQAAGRFIPIVAAGGKGAREDVRKAYQALAADPGSRYRRAVEYFAELDRTTLGVRTPVRELDLAFAWAKAALDGLIVDNPDLGRGLVAGLGPSGTGGRPGFGWFVGTDAYLNSLSFNSFGNFGAARDGLGFTRKWQRKDGKMAHELSQAAGYLRWWEDYPYGYIHGDTSPYYVIAVEDYVRWSGDLAFLRESWPSIVKAYDWSLATDADGDGLMDNGKAGLGALEFGALTGIQTDIYLGAVWVKANQALRAMAAAMGDKVVAKKAEANGARAAAAWKEKFWDAANGQYSYAFNKDGKHVAELTPWSAVGLAWGLGDLERGVETLARMNRSDLTTDWGVRMLSDKSPLFEPLNYNYGACWPFLSGWVAAALFEFDFLPQAEHVLMANARHTYDNALGTVLELFSGHQNAWPQEGVPHQGFSSTGIVLPFVRGLLGLDGSALDKTAAFRPGFPAAWPAVSVSNWRIGAAVLSVELSREKGRIGLRVRAENAGGFKFAFAPALGLGAGGFSASLNGRPLEIKADAAPSAQSARPRLEFPLSGDDTVELLFTAGPEIVLPETASATGDASSGLRLVRSRLAAGALGLSLEGRAGESYAIEVLNGERVASAEGAAFDGRKLTVTFPGLARGYAPAEVTLRLK
ncbi:MAG TPA: GH116 family glycosyl hydrolase [Acidobacteriota bacterium]|nr:GH116 family glycosyl hydrolase [Acidobacteriota bacterium]